MATGPRHATLVIAARELALIAFASVILTAALWAARPDRLPLRADAAVYELELPVPLIAPATALPLFAAGTHRFVDAREQPSGGTVPGAFAIASPTFDADLTAVLDFIYPEDPIVVYDDGTMQTAASVAARFLERGYADVVILRGGLPAWRDAGGEVAGGDDHGS